MLKMTNIALFCGLVFSLFFAANAPAFGHDESQCGDTSGSTHESLSVNEGENFDPVDTTGTDTTTNSDATCSLNNLPAELANSLRLPKQPNIIRETEVASAAEFNSAAAQPGTRIIVTSDISERVFIAASDIEIVNQAFVRELWFCETKRGCQGDSRTGTAQPYGVAIHRIRVQGGVYGHMMFPRPHGDDQRYITDIDIQNVKVDSTLSSTADSAVRVRGKRVMITDSELRGEEYSVVSLHNDPLQTEDLVIRCSILNSFAPAGVKNEATMRIMNINRSVLVGSVLQNGKESNWSDTATSNVDSKHTYRVHFKSDLIYVANNQFNNSGVMFGDFGSSAAGDIGTIWFINNVWYNRSDGWFNPKLSAGGSIDKIVAKGNNVYREGASNYNFFGSQQDVLETQVQVVDENNQMHDFKFPPNHWLD